MDNEKAVCVSIQAEKKFFVFDDYFYSNHPIEIVKDYINTIGVGEDDIDKWFSDTSWDVNDEILPENYLDFGVDVTIQDQQSIHPYNYPHVVLI